MRTLILIKPDAVKRNLIGQIISRFETKGLKVVAIKLIWDRDKLVRHYAEHSQSTHFDDLIASMMKGPLVAMILESRGNTVGYVRCLVGPYKNRIPGTIRYDYAINDRENSVHASDSPLAVLREIGIWFQGEGL